MSWTWRRSIIFFVYRFEFELRATVRKLSFQGNWYCRTKLRELFRQTISILGWHFVSRTMALAKFTGSDGSTELGLTGTGQFRAGAVGLADAASPRPPLASTRTIGGIKKVRRQLPNYPWQMFKNEQRLILFSAVIVGDSFLKILRRWSAMFVLTFTDRPVARHLPPTMPASPFACGVWITSLALCSNASLPCCRRDVDSLFCSGSRTTRGGIE